MQAIDNSKPEDRDPQEVVGYFYTLDMIADNYANIDVTTSNIKSLHKTLMNHSKNDEWRRGIETQLLPREKSILLLIQNYPGNQSGEIAAKLNIPNLSVKRHPADLKDKGLITQQGAGRGINCSAS